MFKSRDRTLWFGCNERMKIHNKLAFIKQCLSCDVCCRTHLPCLWDCMYCVSACTMSLHICVCFLSFTDVSDCAAYLPASYLYLCILFLIYRASDCTASLPASCLYLCILLIIYRCLWNCNASLPASCLSLCVMFLTYRCLWLYCVSACIVSLSVCAVSHVPVSLLIEK